MNAVRRLEKRLAKEIKARQGEAMGTGTLPSEAVILVRGLRSLKAGLRAAMEYQRTVGDKKQTELIEEDLVLLYRLEAHYLQYVPEGVVVANDHALEEFLAKVGEPPNKHSPKELNEKAIEQLLVDVRKPGMTTKLTHIVRRKR